MPATDPSTSASARLPWRGARPERAWRWAPLLLLAGCHYASSPVVGFGSFIGDTHTFQRNPNLPPGSDENVLRAQGRDSSLDPLLPEAGNIWPGPPPPVPSLSDIQQQQLQEEQSIHLPPTPSPPGSSTPPSLPRVSPPTAPMTTIQPSGPGVTPTPIPPLSPPVISTPSGPLINNGPIGRPGGLGTATNPVTGGQSIVVPNGNGTNTIINPDGSTQIVPAKP